MAPSDRPTHGNAKQPPPRARAVAAALEHSKDAGRAPRVVATGRGAVAEQILALAFANGVRVREDPDLAELLSAVDLDSEIPVEAFAAVAEILSYVYRANGDGASDPRADAAAWAKSASSAMGDAE